MQSEVLQSEMQRLITASQSVDKESSRKDSQLRVSAKALEFIGAVRAKKETQLMVKYDTESMCTVNIHPRVQ